MTNRSWGSRDEFKCVSKALLQNNIKTDGQLLIIKLPAGQDH